MMPRASRRVMPAEPGQESGFRPSEQPYTLPIDPRTNLELPVSSAVGNILSE